MKTRLTSVLLAVPLLQACAVKFNDRQTNSHFVFPNSNVTMMAPVQSTISRWSVILPPTIDAEDVHELMDQAKRQVAGADLVMNYRTETVFRSFLLPIYNITITLDGTAAKMSIGEQRLIENADY